MSRLHRTVAAVVTAAVVVVPAASASAAAAPHWTADRTLSANDIPGGTYFPESLSENQSGAAVAVWHTASKTEVAVKRASGAWTAAKVLTAQSNSPAFAGIGASGRAVVVWQARRLMFMQYRPKSGWTAPRALPGGLTSTVATPLTLGSFAMSAAGNGVIAYSYKRIAYVRVITACGWWRAPVRVSSATVTGTGAKGDLGASRDQAVISGTGAVSAWWFWTTTSTEASSGGVQQYGGTMASGVRAPVRSVPVPGGGLAGGSGSLLSASPTGRSVAFSNPFSNRSPSTITYRVNLGPWRTQTVAPSHDPFSVAITDQGLTAWWSTYKTTGSSLWTAHSVGTSWSTPTVIARAPAGELITDVLGARGTGQEAVTWDVQQRTRTRYTNTLHLRTTVGASTSNEILGSGLDAEGLGGTLVPVAMVAAGSHDAFLWRGKLTKTSTAPLFVRTR